MKRACALLVVVLLAVAAPALSSASETFKFNLSDQEYSTGPLDLIGGIYSFSGTYTDVNHYLGLTVNLSISWKPGYSITYSLSTDNKIESTVYVESFSLTIPYVFTSKSIGANTVATGLSGKFDNSIGNAGQAFSLDGSDFDPAHLYVMVEAPNAAFGPEAGPAGSWQSMAITLTVVDLGVNSQNAEIQGYAAFNSTFASVPIPGTIFLLGSGLAGIAAFRKKFRKA